MKEAAVLTPAELNRIKGDDIVGYGATRVKGEQQWVVSITALVDSQPVTALKVRAPSHVQALRLINAFVSRK